MSYRVEYSLFPEHPPKDSVMRRNLTPLFFAAFLVLVWNFWPEGREVLLRLLWPFDRALTAQAAAVFQDASSCGASMGQAVEGFCRTMVQGSGIGH